MKVVILQSNYLPWKGYFDLINDADIFVFYDDVQYTKNDWRNRNRIYSKNGLHWLTIPIPKNAVKKKINEVVLPDHRWQQKHLNALTASYGKAPYFQEIKALLDVVYTETTWRSLSTLNRYLIEEIAARLGCRTEFKEARSLDLSGGRVERVLGMLKQLNASEYISGPSARGYLEGSEHLFAEHQIKLTYKDYTGYPPYPQWKTPFEHGVSILDLIAHVSFERAPYYIWGWRDSTWHRRTST